MPWNFCRNRGRFDFKAVCFADVGDIDLCKAKKLLIKYVFLCAENRVFSGVGTLDDFYADFEC